jgi:hypothetical protein
MNRGEGRRGQSLQRMQSPIDRGRLSHYSRKQIPSKIISGNLQSDQQCMLRREDGKVEKEERVGNDSRTLSG